MSLQVALPESYVISADAQLLERIWERKRQLGSQLLILGHHYQRDEIIQFADYQGDSLKLAQHAASRGDAKYIVFCGVHFMAESADILSQPHQVVILPDMDAGCSMADMASLAQVEDCWEILTSLAGETVLPVVYINSTAEIKEFVGRRGGAICTSSNAAKAMKWAWGQKEKVLFLPDQHLGRNTAARMGVSLDEMVLWDPELLLGGNTPEALKKAKLILWKGHCSVHQRFRAERVEWARREYPGIKIIVHPECPYETCKMADSVGSTEFIKKTITESPPGSIWGVGTEVNLVNRLAKQNPDKTVILLDPVVCVCTTMYRIDPQHLAWVLDNLAEGRIVNQVKVPAQVAEGARLALDRMLSLT